MRSRPIAVMRSRKAATDIDPREFVLDVAAWPADKTVKLTVVYAACTDRVCHVVKQSYVLSRRRDTDGGVPPNSGFRGVTADGMLKLLLAGDKNGDGKLTRDELNSVLRERFEEFDLNKDGVLDPEEIRKMAERLMDRKKL